MIERLFREGALLVPCPWPRAGRSKRFRDVDARVVAGLLSRAPGEDLEEVDPEELRATQPSVTRAGVAYYLTDAYARTGTTYADLRSAANRVPVVYRRDDGQSLILTGHHRSAAALLQGVPLLARVVQGGWGGPRSEVLAAEPSAATVPTRPLHVTALLAVGADGGPVVGQSRTVVGDEAQARRVLASWGCPDPDERLHFARSGRTGGGRDHQTGRTTASDEPCRR